MATTRRTVDQELGELDAARAAPRVRGPRVRGRRVRSRQLRRRYDAVLGDRLPLVLDAQRRAPSRFIVRVSESSRKDADALCAKLKAAGGACIVLRNPRD